ncbi:MAG: hypothetical protein H8D56_15375 [Planctomycetes bacterium]|nr:hypothetical protein [Planctomycetota bacterium]
MWLVWESTKHFKDYLDNIDNSAGSGNNGNTNDNHALKCMPAIGGLMPVKEDLCSVNIGDNTWINFTTSMEYSPNAFHEN